VVVTEHGGGYFAPVLSHPATIHGWTHVALVYQDKGPILYLNGNLMEVLWAAPHRVDVTPLLRSGSNKLEVRVWNTWHNRLLGAHLKVPGLPDPAPSVTTKIRFPAGAKPMPAGLAGPVLLRFE
jgi:hypothetical protein